MKMQTHDIRVFFRYVLPAILSFSLSGVYCIVDGYFIGNRLGDTGLSAVTIAYPIVALLQAIGTGLGMGAGYGRGRDCGLCVHSLYDFCYLFGAARCWRRKPAADQ